MTVAKIEKEGTIFGEMSVLGKLGNASASIFADNDCSIFKYFLFYSSSSSFFTSHLFTSSSSFSFFTNKQNQRMEVNLLFLIFQSHPQIAQRFYISMGVKLARLLNDISSVAPSRSSQRKKKALSRSSSYSTSLTNSNNESSKKLVSDHHQSPRNAFHRSISIISVSFYFLSFF